METALAIVSGLGVAGVAILGILYGLAQKKVAALTIQVSELLKVKVEVTRLRQVAAELQAKIMVFQKEQYEEMSEDELVAVVNDIFYGSLLRDPGDSEGSN